jgi:hypothetical protein
MKKFETKEELVEWIETMHLQNTNGRETEEEMFRLGIEAAIEELIEFNLLGLHNVSKRYCVECDCDITDSKYNFVCEHCRLQT